MPIEIGSFIAPIFVGQLDDTETFIPVNVLGTAFSIGKEFFLTAGHVVRAAKDYKMMVLGFMRDYPGHFQFCPVSNCEYKDSIDVGLISAKLYEVKPLPWNPTQLLALDDVRASGFPFGYDNKNKLVFVRSFKGHIVSAARSPEPPLFGYELSFHCPRGISGAPLITNNNGQYSVRGLITGNSSVEIEIYSETEMEDNGKERKTYMKTETTTFGNALQASEILALHFQSLNGTVEQHLQSQGLLR